MSSKRHAATALAALLCAFVSGCFVIGGGTTNRNRPNTVGQELLDLKAAHEKGAITQEEFDVAKQKVLESPPQPHAKS